MQSKEKDNKSYRNIIKGTAIFGGVQVFNVIINILRGKLVAMILGTEGVGISSLFNSASTPLQQVASLGMNSSAVKEISQGLEDQEKTNELIKAFRFLLIISSLIASVLTIIFSSKLSQITFGSTEYTFAFILLSIVIFLNSISSGEIAILQGFRHLKRLAFCSIVGPLCGLFIGVPLYYWKGKEAIVPAMLVLAIITYIFNRFGTKKLGIGRISLKNVREIGKPIIMLGVLLMVASLLGNLTTYFTNTFIRHFGSINDVGLYQAANSITNQYVGLIFSAMATDYYPRLASIVNDKIKMLSVVNQQSEIVLLIVAPIAMIMIISAPLLIRVLLTTEFTPIVEVIRFMALGVIFKAMAFPLGYISFSKGDKKFFFYCEGIYTNIKTFVVFALFYYFLGFNGLGIAALTSSLLDIIAVVILTKWRYGFNYSKDYFKLAYPLIILAIVCFMLSYINNILISFGAMIATSAIATIYSYIELDKRIDIRNLINRKKQN